MPVKLAKTAGFCMGVRRAMNLTFKLMRRRGAKIKTFGPLIHNPQVLDLLKRKQIESIEDPKQGAGSIVVIRAHGVGPELRRSLRQCASEVADATCPRVGRVQGIIKKHATKGEWTVIVGDKGHGEVEGLLAFANGRGVVVSSVEEAASVRVEGSPCVVAQTTQNQQVYDDVVAALRKRYPECQVYDTICDSTSSRQAEVRELASNVDAMVVVGGRNSANTTRLMDIARETGTPTYHVETAAELRPEWFKDKTTVGVTAGASTPTWMINRVVARLEGFERSRARPLWRWLYKTMDFAIKGYIMLAVGAGALTYANCLLLGIKPRFSFVLVASAYVLAMSLSNYFTDKAAAELNEPSRIDFYEEHRRALIAMAIVAELLALGVSALLGWACFLILGFSLALGATYSLPLVPKRLSKFFGYRRLRDIPGSKDLFSSLAWGVVTVLLPILAARAGWDRADAVTFLLTFGMVFARSVLCDIKDIQGDLMLGRETIPIILGTGNTRVILVLIVVGMAVGLSYTTWLGWVPPLGYYLLVCIGYMSVYLIMYHLRLIFQRLTFDLVVDSNFLLAGILAGLYSAIGTA